MTLWRLLCRALGRLTRLKQLHVQSCSVQLPEARPGAVDDRPALHAVQHIKFGDCPQPLMLAQMLACSLQVPAGVQLHGLWEPYLPQLLYVNGWGRSWLPAMLATSRQQRGYTVVAAEDGDVDHYLALVAATAPRQQQAGQDVVWLGEDVTPAGFSRLLSCPQQPPLRVEVGTLALTQPTPLCPQGSARLRLAPAHFRALIGVSAPLLVSMALADCTDVTNCDVAMLAGACHALKVLRLLGAWRLTDMALHALALGCRRLEGVELTQARVTEEGVAVALSMLGELRELVLGDLPAPALVHLEGRVQREMPAADYRRWAVGRPHAGNKRLTWTRSLVGGELFRFY
jgi:hypothetical protein